MDDFRVDNPGGEWLKHKQEDASKNMWKHNGLRGATTGYFHKPIELPTSVLKHIDGANGEHRFRNGGQKLSDLEHEVGHPDNFDTKKHPIMIGINHRGQAYAMEGNHRIAYAAKHGIKTVHAEVKYYNGGEAVDGPWHPKTVHSLRYDVKEQSMLTFKEFIAEGQKSNINMTQKDLHRHLSQRGWSLERNRGDHDVYGHPESTHKIAVPRHKGNIAPGTVRQIVKAADVLDKKVA